MIHRTLYQSSPSFYSQQDIQSDRAELLQRHKVKLPETGKPGWADISPFLEGKSLSPDDCRSLSIWLEAAGPQNIDLLSSMQALEKSFIPMLCLRENDLDHFAPTQRPLAPAALLEQALDKGLLFRVEFFSGLPEDAARALQTAMSHSRVTALSYPSHHPPESSHTREWLRLGLENCPSLQEVETQAGFLPLLKGYKVPEVKLRLMDGTPDSCAKDLDDVLSAGGISSFTLLSRDVQLHCMVPIILQRANAHLPPSRCLSALKMEGIDADYTLRFSKKKENKHHLTQTVRALFKTPHLRDLTLPDPHWLMAIPASELLEALYHHDLMSLTVTGLLQPTFEGRPICTMKDYDDLHWRIYDIFQLKRQREYCAFVGAAAWFAPAVTKQYEMSDSAPMRHAAGMLLEPLANAIVAQYQETATPEGSALASLNKATAEAARKARKDFDQANETDIRRLVGKEEKEEEVPALSLQSVLDNCPIQ